MINTCTLISPALHAEAADFVSHVLALDGWSVSSIGSHRDKIEASSIVFVVDLPDGMRAHRCRLHIDADAQDEIDHVRRLGKHVVYMSQVWDDKRHGTRAGACPGPYGAPLLRWAWDTVPRNRLEFVGNLLRVVWREALWAVHASRGLPELKPCAAPRSGGQPPG